MLLSDILTGLSNVTIFGQIEGTMNTDGKLVEESVRTLMESSRILVESTIEQMYRLLRHSYLLRFMIIQYTWRTE